MFGLGMSELLVIMLVVLLLFGAKNLPEMAKSLGKSMREFRKAANEIKDSVAVDLKQDDVAAAKKVETIEQKA
jgi:sec-independent protein translocase protein TatA